LKDLELAGIYLKNLINTEFLNQGQLMTQTIIECLKEEVPGTGAYMDSRLKGFKEIPSLPRAIQNELNPSIKREIKDTDYAAVSTGPWIDSAQLVAKVYFESEWNQRYENYIFDLPFLHGREREGLKFIESLENHSDIKIFSYKSIQILINKHWDKRQKAIYALKLIPYTAMLAIFMVWSNLVLSYSHTYEPNHAETAALDLNHTVVHTNTFGEVKFSDYVSYRD